MSDDQYTLDIELHFAHGDPIYATLTEGRDTYRVDDGVITLNIKANPDESIVYTARRPQLNYTKVTRRKLELEPKPGWIAPADNQ